MRRAREVVVSLRGRDPVTPFLGQASYEQAICWLGACLAEALKYAHERGLVHLDLKPSNVLLTADRQPMLLDFHLAQEALEPGARGIHFGGTPGYMSPEQAQAIAAIRQHGTVTDTIDGRSDIYSLGLVLYEALGGQFDSDAPERRARSGTGTPMSPPAWRTSSPGAWHRDRPNAMRTRAS